MVVKVCARTLVLMDFQENFCQVLKLVRHHIGKLTITNFQSYSVLHIVSEFATVIHYTSVIAYMIFNL